VGIFGWSYPPGCSGPPDEDFPCEVCGLFPDDCICPECPICGEYGQPSCYLEHGLRRTEQQKFLKEIFDREMEKYIQAENAMWDDYMDDEERQAGEKLAAIFDDEKGGQC